MNISINITKRGVVLILATVLVLLGTVLFGYRQITKTRPVEGETAQQEIVEDQSATDEATEDQSVEPQEQGAQVAESSEQ